MRELGVRDTSAMQGGLGSIFYHCSVLSSLMDPTWAEHRTIFRHIAQAGEGRTKRARRRDRARRINTWERRTGREGESGSHHLPKTNHNSKHANMLFHRHAVIVFPITPGPEYIWRSWVTTHDKDAEKWCQKDFEMSHQEESQEISGCAWADFLSWPCKLSDR